VPEEVTDQYDAEIAAILFYGIPLPEDYTPEDLPETAADYEHAKERREMPWPKLHDDAVGPEWMLADDDPWWVLRDEWRARQVELEYYGPEADRRLCIVVMGSVTVATDSRATLVTNFAVDPSWRRKVAEYGRDLGVPFVEPGWHLMARGN
jgi:hypothetical protein